MPIARRRSRLRAERVEVTIPSTYGQDHKVYLGTELIRTEVVQERVRQKMETSPRKGRESSRRSQASISGELTEVTDLLKAAGVEQVGFVTKAPTDR